MRAALAAAQAELADAEEAAAAALAAAPQDADAVDDDDTDAADTDAQTAQHAATPAPRHRTADAATAPTPESAVRPMALFVPTAAASAALVPTAPRGAGFCRSAVDALARRLSRAAAMVEARRSMHDA